MVSKEKRHAAIARLIRRTPVRTQAELIRRLAAAGIVVDQSTLSRDLSELGVRKTGGRYAARPADQDDRQAYDPAVAVRWFTTCGAHQIVVRTRVGQAQPVALAIDEKEDASILATIAGDDTVFVAIRTVRAQAVALRRLKQWFGDKYER
ncbi:MAG: arginine repressor [Phycisphaerae bacterium]